MTVSLEDEGGLPGLLLSSAANLVLTVAFFPFFTELCNSLPKSDSWLLQSSSTF